MRDLGIVFAGLSLMCFMLGVHAGAVLFGAVSGFCAVWAWWFEIKKFSQEETEEER
jgi:hypothetical protein